MYIYIYIFFFKKKKEKRKKEPLLAATPRVGRRWLATTLGPTFGWLRTTLEVGVCEKCVTKYQNAEFK
jgi:hypothetical protein